MKNGQITLQKTQRDFNAQYGFLTVKITDEIYTWKNINAKFKNIAREG